MHKNNTFAVGRKDGSYQEDIRLSANVKRNATLGRLLGGDLSEKIHKAGSGDGRERGEADVDTLLLGAEKLCGV